MDLSELRDIEIRYLYCSKGLFRLKGMVLPGVGARTSKIAKAGTYELLVIAILIGLDFDSCRHLDLDGKFSTSVKLINHVTVRIPEVTR